jgi:hypothetical protein
MTKAATIIAKLSDLAEKAPALRKNRVPITIAQPIGKNRRNENFDSAQRPTASPSSTARPGEGKSIHRSKVRIAAAIMDVTARSVVATPA